MLSRATVVGIGTLAHSIDPRVVAPVTLTLVLGSLHPGTVGALARAPNVLRDLSPFPHVAPYPAAPVRPTALVALAAVGVFATALALATITRRDVRAR